MKVACRAYQNKHLGLLAAIERSGHRVVVDRADVVLLDHDGPEFYRNYVEAFHQAGIKILIYPHGACSQVAWDGIYPVSNEIYGYLAFSDGHARIMDVYGYPKPIANTGWHWCGQVPYHEPGRVERVLFAPIHPLGDGQLRGDQAKANQDAMTDILNNFSPDVVLVRYIGSLGDNGLETVAGVNYRAGRMDNSTGDIDAADIVVSYGTPAYLAVARGKPTVFINQDIHPAIEQDGYTIKAKHWHYYRDDLRYPVSKIADLGKDRQAEQEWRDLFIGPQITPEGIGNILNEVAHVC